MSDNSHLQQLAEIRSMMEKSSRFISLSGMSGVMAGIYAIGGAAYVHFNMDHRDRYSRVELSNPELLHYILVALAVVGLSLITGFFLTQRRAKSQGQKLIDRVAFRMLVNLSIPMMTGALFAIVLLVRGNYELIAPVLLMFYGLGLINGSKYTLDDIRMLGILEVMLGISCAILPEMGLIFWTLGFGFLHILYGLRMWFKYERS